MGRPKGSTKLLTEKLTNAICERLEKAMPLCYAAERNEIPRRTVEEWITRGKAGDPPYDKFFLAVQRARAVAVENMHDLALEGGKGSGAAMWMLERRYRDDYAPPTKEVEKQEVAVTFIGGNGPLPR